ncbi:hypothetical protein CYLTODRAFT_454432 [Cylindrobasidium torrendii FP15055 ss-10]|uniref:Pet127-domain-containing protein n=1 Tax=Cylindrobasidium torrendii FP15055 ss-10 TaxID=1314674 RepID=A0A0D7BD53_9AGAR|nr:hypothetical protein CYLTODRAFT_454432 [Cylindrobasidium torrendii FP15055 ss-10]
MSMLDFQDVPCDPYHPVPQLSHELDRVLFNPTVHWTRDPRTQIRNFPEDLTGIPKLDLRQTPPQNPQTLGAVAQEHDKGFASSASTLASILPHFYYAMAGASVTPFSPSFAWINQNMSIQPTSMSIAARSPRTLSYRHVEGGTCVVECPGESSNLLETLKQSLEAPLISPATKTSKPPFRYTKSRTFLIQSRPSFQDLRLPGAGLFNLRTRTIYPVRRDILDAAPYKLPHRIDSNIGRRRSFEHEQFDLLRSELINYCVYAHLADTDGALVAYHNTSHIFGFEYLAREAMDDAIFGPKVHVSSLVKHCMHMFENVSAAIVASFPGRDVRATFKVTEKRWLQVLIEPTVPSERDIPKHLTVCINPPVEKTATGSDASPLSTWEDCIVKYGIVDRHTPPPYDEKQQLSLLLRQGLTGVRNPDIFKKLAAYWGKLRSSDGASTQQHEWEQSLLQSLIHDPDVMITALRHASKKYPMSRGGLHISWDIHPSDIARDMELQKALQATTG